MKHNSPLLHKMTASNINSINIEGRAKTTTREPSSALKKLFIPPRFNRNSAAIRAAGYLKTGQTLIRLATRRMGLPNLANTDVLDVGCGVRFVGTIINKQIPIKSYTGIEVCRPIVRFLNHQVAANDQRFKFYHWNAQNDLYNRSGTSLAHIESLPANATFDAIWLFSVFTHLNPADARAMLKILRPHMREKGRLFFTAFIDPQRQGFRDMSKQKPLLHARYGKKLMESIIQESGWAIQAQFPVAPKKFIQHSFLCSVK